MPDEYDTETLAKEVLAELDPGTRIDDKFILSRRQLLAIAGGSGAVGLLTKLGIEEAEAQSAAGQVGTSSEPVDVKGFDISADNSITDPSGTTHSGELADASDTANVSSSSVSGGYDLTIDGDTYEFRT